QIHKITHGLTHDSQVNSIVVEDLHVAGMLKNRKLSQAISDVGFGEFVRQLKYKCDWYGKNFIRIGRFEPSSKRCSECGSENKDLTLSDREWICQNCGVLHDRDFNAAKNIREMGLYNRSAGVGSSGEPVEKRRLRRSVKQENTCV
ncbi:MAG TPA: RNA-guided endonuclease TnpB family protein, partial [Puia sp.]|nr:RNA-guided endonuclease TnpB family protein [Puia sp.]